MTKLTESSESKAAAPKKARWPLLVGVWAIVEAVASGWGVGAAFLARYWQVSPLSKNKLAILRNPETAKKLSGYQAHQLLFSFSLVYFIPLIFYLIFISVVKIYLPNSLVNVSSYSFLHDILQNACIYSMFKYCPTSFSFIYFGITIFFIVITIFMVVLSTKNIMMMHIKSYFFRVAYNKLALNFVMPSMLVLILFALSFVAKNFVELFIRLLTPGEINFNAYLQGSIVLIFIPLFSYTIFLYVFSSFIFINIMISIKRRNNTYSDLEWIELFNLVLDAKKLSEIKNICGILEAKTSREGRV